MNFHEMLAKQDSSVGPLDLRATKMTPTGIRLPRLVTGTTPLVITGETSTGQRVRPSDWTSRLAGMVAAYTSEAGTPEVSECRACGDRRCIQVGPSVAREHPGLLADIQLFARVADAVDYTQQCPKLKSRSPKPTAA